MSGLTTTTAAADGTKLATRAFAGRDSYLKLLLSVV